MSELKQLDRELLDNVLMRNLNRVRQLLGQGADVNTKDHEHQETPLMRAVKHAKADMVRMLLEAGAAVDTRGCDIAMMCAGPGSSSQRNAERQGFRIAYTRVKWHV